MTPRRNLFKICIFLVIRFYIFVGESDYSDVGVFSCAHVI
jgi:hypothetical protein